MKAGFSLIELMMVLVIIGVLSVVSYPLYNAHIIRVHRICATTSLLAAAGEMEKYHLLHNTYKGANFKHLSIDNLVCEEIYNFVVSRQEDSTYILEAIPIGKQVKDIECGTLTLDQNGSRWASGGGAKCWL